MWPRRTKYFTYRIFLLLIVNKRKIKPLSLCCLFVQLLFNVCSENSLGINVFNFLHIGVVKTFVTYVKYCSNKIWCWIYYSSSGMLRAKLISLPEAADFDMIWQMVVVFSFHDELDLFKIIKRSSIYFVKYLGFTATFSR